MSFRRILVATDGSKRSLHAVRTAVDLAKVVGARLVSVYVIEEGVPTLFSGEKLYASPALAKPYRKALRAIADAALDAVARAAAEAGVAHQAVRTRSSAPWQAIVHAAQAHDCDLIVMATRGRRGLRMLGSHAMRAIAHTTIPVLVCR
jgi:nucleotide-binding universal stress UspA family protein